MWVCSRDIQELKHHSPGFDMARLTSLDTSKGGVALVVTATSSRKLLKFFVYPEQQAGLVCMSLHCCGRAIVIRAVLLPSVAAHDLSQYHLPCTQAFSKLTFLLSCGPNCDRAESHSHGHDTEFRLPIISTITRRSSTQMNCRQSSVCLVSRVCWAAGDSSCQDLLGIVTREA